MPRSITFARRDFFTLTATTGKVVGISPCGIRPTSAIVDSEFLRPKGNNWSAREKEKNVRIARPCRFGDVAMDATLLKFVLLSRPKTKVSFWCRHSTSLLYCWSWAFIYLRRCDCLLLMNKHDDVPNQLSLLCLDKDGGRFAVDDDFIRTAAWRNFWRIKSTTRLKNSNAEKVLKSWETFKKRYEDCGIRLVILPAVFARATAGYLWTTRDKSDTTQLWLFWIQVSMFTQRHRQLCSIEIRKLNQVALEQHQRFRRNETCDNLTLKRQA